MSRVLTRFALVCGAALALAGSTTAAAAVSAPPPPVLKSHSDRFTSAGQFCQPGAGGIGTVCANAQLPDKRRAIDTHHAYRVLVALPEAATKISVNEVGGATYATAKQVGPDARLWGFRVPARKLGMVSLSLNVEYAGGLGSAVFGARLRVHTHCH